MTWSNQSKPISTKYLHILFTRSSDANQSSKKLMRISYEYEYDIGIMSTVHTNCLCIEHACHDREIWKIPLYDLFDIIFCSNDFVIFGALCVRLCDCRFYRRRYKSNHMNIGAEREKNPSKGPQSNEIFSYSSHASWNGRLIGMASILLFIASTQ